MGVAVLKYHTEEIRKLGVPAGAKMVTVLCGGNVDMDKPMCWMKYRA